jgi:hypothetical protein
VTRLQLREERIDIDVPPGWDVLVSRASRFRDADRSTRNPLIHAANFALPARRGDFGSGAVEVMGSEDVFVSLFEYGPESAGQALFASEGLPRQIDPDLFHPRALQRVIPGQAGYQRFFTENGRPFCLYVVLGGYANRQILAPSVQGFLEGLDVRP